ncbi:MAG: UvrD-helicase domain-containing protein [Thermodesulfobacteriota bacterium]|nr:UvrD-helicase domain-containing protein [Thermodesulfobacteriota bacterium]
MKYIADLHLHSHFARATAKNLDLEHMYMAAQLKGVTLVGTGDFTHPGWLAELEEKLMPAEPGLFKLKKEIADKLDREIPDSCRNPVRFILQCEISSIYKKNERVRKNHNLIYFSEIEKVKKFNARLDQIGNLKSDGRPILGLDAEKLLGIMLETSEEAFLIPAHIWTPWFSMFGSKSGFDSIEECFGSLANHIFAVETGLSSDPPMNWRVEDLDNVRLVASSDAHSPMYIGRNASLFDTDLSFHALREALEKGDMEKFQGTVDMYPQEGKYHYDGHRKCNICFNPEETLENHGICPECNRPLTLGVLYRVQQLASRPQGYLPENRHGYKSIVPLADLLSEICGVGPKTKKVAAHYNKALKALGPELEILLEKTFDEIEKAGVPLLAEAVARMRKGEVNISPGFDGEYGRVKIFGAGEKQKLKGELDMFSFPGKKVSRKKIENNKRKVSITRKKPAKKTQKKKTTEKRESTQKEKLEKKEKPALTKPKVLLRKKAPKVQKDENPAVFTFNEEQNHALTFSGAPLIIEAGPGTGKTRTLTAKIAYLIFKKGVNPSSLLALTFTNRAAKEIKERINIAAPGICTNVVASTFHSFSLMILKEYGDFKSAVVEESVRKEIMKDAFVNSGYDDKNGRKGVLVEKLDQMIAKAKQQWLSFEDDLGHIADKDQRAVLKRVWQEYDRLLLSQNLVDFEDLISMVLSLLKSDSKILLKIQKRFVHIFVDEYQDINSGQYFLIQLLANKGKGLTVIGDPDQSIYGFRGSDNRYFKKFITDYPGAVKIVLKQNYRSTRTILNASFQMITRAEKNQEKEKIFSDINGKNRLMVFEAASDKAEAVAVGKSIESLVGGLSLFSMDAGRADAALAREYSFSDFAVLYRTKKQSMIFAEIFEKAGIPFQTADKEDFLVQQGIKELISLVRLIQCRGTVFDLENFFDYMKVKAGKKSKEKLRQWFYTLDASISDAIALLADNSLKEIRKDIRERIALAAAELQRLGLAVKGVETKKALQTLADESGIRELISKSEKSISIFNRLLLSAHGCKEGLTEFLDTVALQKDTESIEPDAEKVSLMTIHAAKGLEFPVVFVTGCEQGLLPYARQGGVTEDIDEERRLFYVAMTRAMDILCLTYAKKRIVFGAVKETVKSPFLSDIEEKLKEYSKNRHKLKSIKKKQTQLELF